MDEISVLLKKEKAIQLAMRIIAVFAFAGGFVIWAMLKNAVIGMLVIFVGFIIMTILAFRGQRIQKQAKATYQNGFLKNALAGILPRYDYIEKMENPDVNCFYQYGLLSNFNHVSVSEMLQVQYPEGSLSSMNVHFELVYHSYEMNKQRRREVYWGRVLMLVTKKNFVGETYITYKRNRYVPENPHRLSYSFNHPELDSCYNLSATNSQVLAELLDVDTINLLLELAPLRPIICIKNKVVCVAIHTENRILNYDYKVGFESHTEYVKIQRDMDRERRIMNILH
ncbi:MAG: hypothetical protein J6L77_01495 [Coprococcus sp.]|nr:hypothetical protein [Coprococcus sp.]